MRGSRLLLVLVMGCLIGAFFAFDLGYYLSLPQLQARQAELAALVDRHFVSAALLFVAVYVVSTALSLPGASLLTPGWQRRVRRRLGAAAGLLCQQHWRNAGLSQRPLSAA